MLGERGGEKFICDIKVEKKLLRMWECTGGTEVWGGGKGEDRRNRRKDGNKKSQTNR